jgi:hypothetical protein
MVNLMAEGARGYALAFGFKRVSELSERAP